MRPGAVVTAVLLGVAPLSGQDGVRPAILRGTVWDSVAGRPVADAEVVVGAGLAVATTDAGGRYTTQAPPGRHEVVFRHRDVSEWGALRHAATVDLTAGTTTRLDLATASPATVLARTCAGEGVVVGGQVRDLLTLVVIPTAAVDVRSETSDEGNDMSTSRAGPDGSYHVCLPAGGRLEVNARVGQERGRPIRVAAAAGPVLVHDLFVRVAEPAELRGQVRDADSGAPLADANVELLGTRLRTLTREDGRFLFRGVPPGDVAVAVERLGYGRRVADIRAGGGTAVEVTLAVFPEAIALDSMVVTVSGGTPGRMRTGARFDGLDRPQIEELLPRSIGFDDLLRNAYIPGLRVKEVHYRSNDGGMRPGICVETGRTSTLSADVCQMVEVYLNDVRLLDAETVLLSLDPGSIQSFQLLSRTEAGIQYGGTPRAGNGVLLIFTRVR